MTNGRQGGGEENKDLGNSRWRWWIPVGCVGVVLLAVLVPRQSFQRGGTSAESGSRAVRAHPSERAESAARPKTPATPEEIVAGKVDQFARDRARITKAMAKRLNLELPAEVEQFFKAVAAGHWDELNDLYKALDRSRESPDGEKLRSIWAPILETLLIAECAHAWPAQKLLDYGKATLGSLAPGMVYVGGTDPGRGIPTLLNETSEGDRHVVLTQNALADAGYMDYVRFLYGDQMTMPTPEEAKKAFDEYITDAQRRLQHDQQFPNEPKQIRPGEDVQWLDNGDPNGGSGTGAHVKVSGAVAVMGVNERLLRQIMDNNPGMSFGLEESFPLASTYASAVPLGPIMELRAGDTEEAYTPDQAQHTIDYWSAAAQQLMSDDEAPPGSEVRKTYSKMADAQANLLAAHNDEAQAEQIYRLSMQIEPSSPEAAYGLANLLIKTGRADEAQQVMDNFRQNHPTEATLPIPTLIVPAPGPK